MKRQNMRRWLWACCSCLAVVVCSVSLVHAQQAAPAAQPKRTHDITIEDYFTQAFVTECAMAPDGSSVIFGELRWHGADKPRSTDLWQVDVRSKAVERLTFDAASDHGVQFAPDGKAIFFVSGRKRAGEKNPPYNGTSQVWKMELGSKRLIPVTEVEGGIDAYQLSGDGKTLYYTVSRKHVIDEWKELRQKFSELTYGHGAHQISEIWKLDLVRWQASKLIDATRYIHSFAVSANEKRIAMITTSDQLLINFEGRSRVDIFDTATSKITTLQDDLWRKQAPSPFGWLQEPAWSQDGKHLAFTVFFDGYPSELFVANFSGTGAPKIRKMPRPTDVYIVGGISWRGKENEVCFLGDYHARKRVYGVAGVDTATPTTRTLTDDDVVIDGLSFSADGQRMALVQTGLTYHREVFVGDTQGGAARRVTNVNPQIDTWKLPKISLVSWRGARGDVVEGVLELPADYQPGKPLPMIVQLHGGPTGAENYGMRFWIYGRTLFAAKGYAVFSPNYRGSTGYGDKFLVDLIGHENDIEVEDILKGVDAMIERGIADPTRLGVMGWSNGGFLTNCLITRTNRFKAASSGAGVFDIVIEWAEQDTPGHNINYMQGLPWEKPDAYRKASPLQQLTKKFNTPTLIHCGANDARVPVSHSKALHRALHYYLKVPTELVIYPNTGHTLTQYNHRLAKMRWDHAWFDRYILGKKK